MPELLEAKAYKLADRIVYNGLLVSLETKKGDIRKGIGKDGKPWQVRMPYDYGYLRNTVGADGQHVDVFIGPEEHADTVYVIHQNKENSDAYDEDKAMLGFDSKQAAVAAYKAAYSNGLGDRIYRSCSILSFIDFVKQVYNKANHGKRIEAGGEGSGWFAYAGHIKHTITTTKNNLKKAGWHAEKSPNPSLHDRFVHPKLPGHALHTDSSGYWKHLINNQVVKTGSTTKALLNHFEQQGIYKKGEKPLYGYKGPQGTAATPAKPPLISSMGTSAKAGLGNLGFTHQSASSAGVETWERPDTSQLVWNKGTGNYSLFDEEANQLASGNYTAGSKASATEMLDTITKAFDEKETKQSTITTDSSFNIGDQKGFAKEGWKFAGADSHGVEQWTHAGAGLTMTYSKVSHTHDIVDNDGDPIKPETQGAPSVSDMKDIVEHHLGIQSLLPFTPNSNSAFTTGQQEGYAKEGWKLNPSTAGSDKEQWNHPSGLTMEYNNADDYYYVYDKNDTVVSKTNGVPTVGDMKTFVEDYEPPKSTKTALPASTTEGTALGGVLKSAGYSVVESHADHELWINPNKTDHTIQLMTNVPATYHVLDKQGKQIGSGVGEGELEKHLDKLEQKPTPQIPAANKNTYLTNQGFEYHGNREGADIWKKPGTDVEVHVKEAPGEPGKSTATTIKGGQTIGTSKYLNDIEGHLQQAGVNIAKTLATTPTPSTSTTTPTPKAKPTTGGTPQPVSPSKTYGVNTNQEWQENGRATIAKLFADKSINNQFSSDSNGLYKKAAAALGIPWSSVLEVQSKFGDWQGGTTVKHGNPIGDWIQGVINKDAQVHPGVFLEHAITQERLKERAANGENKKTGGVPDLYRGLSGSSKNIEEMSDLQSNVYMINKLAKTSPNKYEFDFPVFGAEGFSSSKAKSQGTFSNDKGVLIYKPAGNIDPWNVVSCRALNKQFWPGFADEHEWAIAFPNKSMPLSHSSGDRITVKAEADDGDAPQSKEECIAILEELKKSGWDYTIDSTDHYVTIIPPQWMTNENWVKNVRAANPVQACASCESGDCARHTDQFMAWRAVAALIIHAGGPGSGWFKYAGHTGSGESTTPLRRFGKHDDKEHFVNGVLLTHEKGTPDFKAQTNPNIKEPPLPKLQPGQHMAAGLLVMEPNGKDVWVVTPENYYGGYRNTFPKGTMDKGESAQETAVRETYEESGILGKVRSFVGDVQRSTSVTRYYLAERVGGHPADAGPETHTVKLMDIHDPATIERLHNIQDKPTADHKVLQMLKDHLAGADPTVAQQPVQADEPKPATKPLVEPPGGKVLGVEPQSIVNWTKIGEQKGTNPGGTYKDENGKTYYVKFPNSPGQAKSELLADKIYNELDIPAKKGILVSNDKGKDGIATEMIPGGKMLMRPEMAKSADVRKGYVADAYLANWDVFGLPSDPKAGNIMRAGDKDYRIDNGAAMFHRAQGASKEFAHDKVNELESLITGGGQGKGIYHDLPESQKNAQAMALVNTMTPSKIIHLVAESGFKGAEAMKYVQALNGRRDVIAKTFGIHQIKAEMEAGFRQVARFCFSATTTTYMPQSSTKEKSYAEEKLESEEPYSRKDYDDVDEQEELEDKGGLSSKLGVSSPIEGGTEIPEVQKPDNVSQDEFDAKRKGKPPYADDIGKKIAAAAIVATTAKPTCPNCGASDYSLLPADFETAECNKCSKQWDHGIVKGINDPGMAAAIADALEAGGPGSGWFAHAGHIKHTSATMQKNLKKQGWHAIEGKYHDQYVHPDKPKHKIVVSKYGGWTHTVGAKEIAYGNTTKAFVQHSKGQQSETKLDPKNFKKDDEKEFKEALKKSGLGKFGTDKPTPDTAPKTLTPAWYKQCKATVSDALDKYMKSGKITAKCTYDRNVFDDLEWGYTSAEQAKMSKGKGAYAEAAAKLGISPSNMIAMGGYIDDWVGSSSQKFRTEAGKVLANDPKANPAMVLEHEFTVQMLQRSGVKTLDLYRGMSESARTKPLIAAIKAGKTVTAKLGGVDSWSTSKMQADSFASSDGIVLHESKVPVRNVITSYKTNPKQFGSYNSEQEYVTGFPGQKLKLSPKNAYIKKDMYSAADEKSEEPEEIDLSDVDVDWLHRNRKPKDDDEKKDVDAGGPGSGRKPQATQQLSPAERVKEILKKPWHKQTDEERHYVAFHDPRQRKLFKSAAEIIARALQGGGPGSGRHPYGLGLAEAKKYLGAIIKKHGGFVPFTKGGGKIKKALENNWTTDDVKKVKASKPVTLDLGKANVLTTQTVIDPSRTIKLLGKVPNVEAKGKYPMVAKYGGNLIILDGHHRMCASYLTGHKPQVQIIDAKKFISDKDIEAGGEGSGQYIHKKGYGKKDVSQIKEKPSPFAEPPKQMIPWQRPSIPTVAPKGAGQAKALLAKYAGNSAAAWNQAHRLMEMQKDEKQKDYWRQVRDQIPLSDAAKLQLQLKQGIGIGEQKGVIVKPTKSMIPQPLPNPLSKKSMKGGGPGSGPHLLYHGTNDTFAQIIKERGLKIKKGASTVTSDKAYAERAAQYTAKEHGGTPTIVTLKPSAAKFFDEGIADLHNALYTGRIHPRHIEAGGPGSGPHPSVGGKIRMVLDSNVSQEEAAKITGLTIYEVQHYRDNKLRDKPISFAEQHLDEDIERGKGKLQGGGPGSGRHPYGRKPKPLPQAKPPKLSSRAQRALENYKPVGTAEQRAADLQEKLCAKALGGKSWPDSEQLDIIVHNGNRLIGIEMKTIMVAGKDRIWIKGKALDRKLDWKKQTKGEMYTVAVDTRNGKHDIYMRSGVGPWYTHNMVFVGTKFQDVAAALKIDKGNSQKVADDHFKNLQSYKRNWDKPPAETKQFDLKFHQTKKTGKRHF